MSTLFQEIDVQVDHELLERYTKDILKIKKELSKKKRANYSKHGDGLNYPWCPDIGHLVIYTNHVRGFLIKLDNFTISIELTNRIVIYSGYSDYRRDELKVYLCEAPNGYSNLRRVIGKLVKIINHMKKRHEQRNK